MDKYTLVVLFMQEDFVAANNPETINNVEKLILEAKANGNGIIFAELPYESPIKDEGYAPTHKRLKDHVVTYDRGRRVDVYDRYVIRDIYYMSSDASCMAKDAAAERGFALDNFVVCGVNTDLGVLQTVLGLAKRLPKSEISVVMDACNTRNDGDCWAEFKPLNIRLI